MKRANSFGFTPIIKCVGFGCNLRCEYCFYRQEPRSSLIMTPLVLKVLIRETYRANQTHSSVSFIWHGGEPLVAGRKFYERVLEFQREYGREGQMTINGIQTNGTLIDEEWAIFFWKNRFQVGVSLDGPRGYHDQYRRYPGGRGSFDDAMRGIEHLKKKGVPFGIVSVITATSVHHPEEVFRFFIDNGLYKIKFSRALGRDKSGRLLDFAPNPSDYGDFLLRILELWLEEDDPRIRITPIVEVFSSLVKGESAAECLFSAVCDRFWIINQDGDVYPCPSEGVGKQWKFGNIIDGFASITRSLAFQAFQERIRELRKPCLKCQWYKVCKGGCTVDYELGSPVLGERNVLCRSFQRLFQKAKRELTKYKLI